MLVFQIAIHYIINMRTLQLIKKAILILLAVLVLEAPGSCSAFGAMSSFLSGEATLKTLSLEDDFAVLASSPDLETASAITSTVATSASSEQPASADNIAIRAVNPGYSTDAGKDSGELIELINLSDTTLILDGVSLLYTAKPTSTNPDGKTSVLYEFPKGSCFVGQSILFRYAESPEVSANSETAASLAPILSLDTSISSSIPSSIPSSTPTQDLTYTPSIAMTGTLTLKNGDEVLSSVCWLGGEDCLPAFSTTVKSRSYTTILRDDETGQYAHTNDYTPLYDPSASGLYLPPIISDSADAADGSSIDAAFSTDPASTKTSTSDASTKTSASSSTKPLASDFDTSASPRCSSLVFSEILTYYEDDASEQFIEFYNSSAQSIQLQGCKLRYKNKLYDLVTASTTLSGYDYFLYHPELKLTKNPTTENLYELFDVNGDLLDTLTLPHGQKSGTSYAKISINPDGSENWQLTYAPTPGSTNEYQEFRSCPVGKVINEATGNCVNATTMTSTLKDCGEGKYRNPETGRCKSYDSDSEQTPCKEGYERNPETGRCRKITENNGADYPLVPITDTEEHSSFIALWAILAIAGLGAAYVTFQFRHEITYFIKKHLPKLKKP